MPDPIITLTTDFGASSPYVAAMKGVILGINPAARLLDLSHAIPPQHIGHAAFFLRSAIPCFPPGILHVVVVDPGVGTDRALLYVEAAGHRLLAPDNGCWTALLPVGLQPERVITLKEASYWRHPVSATFHGRDILAPVAAHLSLDIDPREMGPPAARWVRLELPAPRAAANGIAGEVVFVDHFGNIITNIPADRVRQPPDAIVFGKRASRRLVRWVRAYADAEPGDLVALTSSDGLLEIAIVNGNAAAKLGATAGMAVTVGWAK